MCVRVSERVFVYVCVSVCIHVKYCYIQKKVVCDCGHCSCSPGLQEGSALSKYAKKILLSSKPAPVLESPYKGSLPPACSYVTSASLHPSLYTLYLSIPSFFQAVASDALYVCVIPTSNVHPSRLPPYSAPPTPLHPACLPPPHPAPPTHLLHRSQPVPAGVPLVLHQCTGQRVHSSTGLPRGTT